MLGWRIRVFGWRTLVDESAVFGWRIQPFGWRILGWRIRVFGWRTLVDEPWLTNLGWWIRRFWLTNPTFLVDEPLGWRIRLFGWRTLVDETAVFSCRTLVVEPWLSKRWLTNPLFWLTNPTSTRYRWCSKSSLAKAAGAEVPVQETGEKWHAAVAKSTFASQNAQNTTIADHFWSSDVEKWHAAVARSTFASQNVQNTSLSEPFWKFRCSKMARGCGAKHICQSKCTKHHMLGPLLDVKLFKNGTPLWRELHF